MNISLILKILIGVAGYGVWALMAWFDPTLRPDFLKFNVAMAVGTIGLVLRDMAAPASPDLKIVPMGLMAPAAPVAPRQEGFHTLRFLLLVIFCALVALTLSSCASLTDAGHAAYTFEPVVGADGKATGGCKFSATDGKEFSGRSISATSTADGCQVMVQEGASTAFQGQAIAGKALSVLPSFAPMLLPQGPAALALPQVTQPAAPPAVSGPKL